MHNNLVNHSVRYPFLFLSIIPFYISNFVIGMDNQIFLKDKTNESGIDFIHYAPRPRWCEIGPTVVGAATNEGLNLVFNEEKEF